MDTATTVVTPVAVRVAAGLAWINEHAELLDLDLDRIKVDQLWVGSGQLCPLAQAAGQDWFAIGERAIEAGAAPSDTEWAMLPDDWSRAHGFLWIYYDDERELTAEWRRAILARREAAGSSSTT